MGAGARSHLRAVLRWVLISALLVDAFPVVSSAPVRAQVATAPNVVIVMTDDQRVDQLARMSATNSLLVSHGVRFDRAFASHPLCCPSRASILRGQFAHTTGIYFNEGINGGWAGFRDRGLEASTLATWLDAAGYRTGLVGRYLNGYDAATNHVPPGWDFWRGGDIYSYETGSRTYATHLLTSNGEGFIRSTPQGTPLFLYLAYYAPHAPSKPAPKYATDPRCNGISASGAPSFNEADVSDKPAPVRNKPLMTASQQTYVGTTLPTNQCRALLSVDDGVAAVVRALSETGRLGNTLIVFMSDNGLFLGEHRIQAAKVLTYEEAIRIPVVIRYDPLTNAVGRLDQHFVTNVDIAPTITELAGLDVRPGCPVPPYGPCDGGFDGRSLVPLLAGSVSSWRDDILVENHQSCGVRTERYIFSRYASRQEELYDLVADPYQLTNLLAGAPSPATLAVRDQLLARLKILCSPPAPGVRF